MWQQASSFGRAGQSYWKNQEFDNVRLTVYLANQPLNTIHNLERDIHFSATIEHQSPAWSQDAPGLDKNIEFIP